MPTASHPLARAVASESRLPIWLTHLWQRLHEHERLGLVLGAGVSHGAGIPLWEELVKRLAGAANVSEQRMAIHKESRFPETFLAEILFRKHCTEEERANSHLSLKYRSYHLNSTWRDKIRACLYEDIRAKDFSEIAKGHVYLSPLAKLICQARFAVTFNFDDVVDEAVISCAANAGLPNPEIILRPKVETRKNASVIYHINGLLPREELRRSSENIVLTEDAFADILLSPNSQDAEFVINQFSVRTFLLLGISLNDNSLKNLLRSSAKRNPANHHFIIFHEKDDKPRSPEEREDLFDVNLNVYNLISIFLTSAEIGALLETINSVDGETFDKVLSRLVSRKIERKYYLVGSVAAGKSTTLEALRCFSTYEEWSGRVPTAMYRNDRTLTREEQTLVDDFLFPQLIKKNSNMIGMHSGIRIMDRAFLDLFAFSGGDKKEIKRKATQLKRRFKDWGKPLEDGHIFFLKADKISLEERLARRGSKKRTRGKVRYDTKTLVAQEKELLKIYRPAGEAVIDTSGDTVNETAKRIARSVLLGEYSPFDFSGRLNEVIKKGGEL